MAQRIEDDIVARGWPVGDVLGSEAELAGRYGVSRAVVREAVRITEHNGAGRMRRGPGGGFVIRAPNRDATARAMGLWLSYAGVSTKELLDAGTPLVITAARLAAQRADPDAVTAVGVRAQTMEADGELTGEAFGDLERRVVDLAASPAITLFSSAIADVALARLRSGVAELATAAPVTDRLAYLGGYRALIRDIAKGDEDGAGARMARLNDAAGASLRDRVPPVPPVPAEPVTGTRAEKVAAMLRDEIERAGWPVGEVLGSEAGLTERLGISRAILREAVGILGHHRVVRTKRGPGGGVVVAAPDVAAVIKAARLVLEYEQLTAMQLVEACTAVEVACAGLAAGRSTPEIAEALLVSLDTERSGPPEHVFELEVHRTLAAHSGNRPLELFAVVLGDLTARRVAPSYRQGGVLASMAEQAHESHRAIVEAVGAGDQGLARDLMRRHIESSTNVLE